MDMCGIEDLMANTVLVQAKSNNQQKNKYRKLFKLPESNVSEEMEKMIKIELDNSMPDIFLHNEDKRSLYEFEQLCESQPIGKEMFTRYCKSAENKVKNTHSLLRSIKDYELMPNSEKEDGAECVINSYLLPKSPYEVSIIDDELKEKCCEVVQTNKILSDDELNDAFNNNNQNSMTISVCETKSLVDGLKPTVVSSNMNEKEKKLYFIKLMFGKLKHIIFAYLIQHVFPLYKKSPEYKMFLKWKYKEREPVIEDDFFPFRLLGKGGFGEVYAYQVKSSGKMYACKKIDKKHMKKNRAETIVMAEKITLEMVNSPFIVSLAYAYENNLQLNLVMTLMSAANGKEKGITLEQAKFYTAQITLGIEHLHQADVLYRDMKPENVLLDEKGNVRIADLGLVCILKKDGTTKGKAGTIGFMAPEMLEGKQYAYGVDWFALGCTVFEMIEGRGPFICKAKSKRKMSIGSTIEKTINGKQSYDRKQPSEIMDLIDKLLIKNVANRLAGDERSAAPIKNHPYFSDICWERLEAGLMEPPFVPDPNQVYAKDVSDIALGSPLKGINIAKEDQEFHKKFSTGRVPIPWQQEMIETGLFDDVMNRKPGEEKVTQSKGKSSVCSLL